MAATEDQIQRLRRLANEPELSNEDAAEYIQRHPLLDERGTNPYTWDTTTDPPTQDAVIGWIPTYDLHLAAADLLEETAAEKMEKYSVTIDGQSFDRSKMHAQIMATVRYHRSCRIPTSMVAHVSPKNVDPAVWIGNLPEQDV